MKIKISNLSDGVHNFYFDEDVGELDLKEPFWGNCKVDVELNKLHNQIILNANLTLNAKFDCDRCNKNFDTVLTGSYKIVYLLGTEPVESESLNIAYLPLDADKIELAGDVRDYAFLAIPMKKLCKEDCKGLCVKCGKDLNEGECNCEFQNTDPRWLPLAELKNKINNN